MEERRNKRRMGRKEERTNKARTDRKKKERREENSKAEARRIGRRVETKNPLHYHIIVMIDVAGKGSCGSIGAQTAECNYNYE